MSCFTSLCRVRRPLTLAFSLLLTTAISSAALGAEVTIADGNSHTNSANVTDIFGDGNVGTLKNLTGVTVGNAPGIAVEITGTVGTFENAGLIAGDADAISVGGDVTSFFNAAAGSIESFLDFGVYVAGAVGSFNNSGAIKGEQGGVDIRGGVTSFINAASGTINGATSDGVALAGITSFANAGRITGAASGVYIAGDAALFVNAAGGSIEGIAAPGVVVIGKVGDFTNAGRVLARDQGIYLNDSVGSFFNAASGDITAQEVAVNIVGNAQSFANDGMLRSSDGTPTVLIQGDVGSFTNRGTVTGGGWGIGLGSVDRFFNSGTIAALGPGPRIGVFVAPFGGSTGTTNTFVNTGTIEGSETAVRFEGGVANMINQGVLRGSVNALDSVGVNDDKLTLLTGSKIFGALSFGGGYDTLDFSNFTGNTLLLVGGLERLVPGSTNYVDARNGSAGGEVAIFDISGLGNKAIARGLSDVTASVRNLATDQLLGAIVSQQAIAPLGYVAVDPANGAAATLNGFDAPPASDISIWGGVVGGGGGIGNDPLDLTSRFGGIVAGSHAQLGETLVLGGLAGYVSSSSTMLDDEEMLETKTGMVGLYGKSALGVVDVDFTLLGGISSHTSKRQVVANGTTETATGAFSSVFVSPSVGISIPVLTADATTLLLRGETSYVAGLTSAYTETGSSMNLAVGGQTIGFFDVRIGLEARHDIDHDGGKTELVAKAGVLGQANLGSSSVPVTTLGQTVDASTPGSASYGLYGGIGVDVAVNANLALNMRLDATIRTDGTTGLSAGFGFGGTF